MRLTYSVGAGFGEGSQGIVSYFCLKEFFKKGCLERVFCKFHNSSEMDGIITDFLPKPSGKALDIMQKAACRIGIPNYANYTNSVLYDFLVSKRMGSPEIFYGWQGHCKSSLKKAKEKGALTVLECCNSHIENVQENVSRENRIYGLGKSEISPWVKRLKQEYAAADFLRCPSKFVADSFLERGFAREKIILQPYGVDAEKFRPAKKKDSVFRAVFAGGLIPRKGVFYLLKAWNELELKDAELVVLGKIWNNWWSVGKVINHLKTSNMVFAGTTPYLEKCLQQADVFVFPAIEEGSALVTYDALACGLPLITTPNSGSVARNGKDGFIVPARDTKALKEKIRYFYENPRELKRMGKNARKRALDFGWQKTSQRLVKEFERLA